MWRLGLGNNWLLGSLQRKQLSCHEGIKAAFWRETEASSHLQGRLPYQEWMLQAEAGLRVTATSGETEPELPCQLTPNSWYRVVVVQLLCHVQLFCNPTHCSLPGSSVHGISQARILVWVAVSLSRGSSRLRDQTCVSYIGRQIFYH